MTIRRNTPIGHILDEVFLRLFLSVCKIVSPADVTDYTRTQFPANSAAKQSGPHFQNIENSQKIAEGSYNYYFFPDVSRNKRIFWRLQKNLEVGCTLLIIILFLVLHVQLSFIWIYRVNPLMNLDLVSLNINAILLLPLLSASFPERTFYSGLMEERRSPSPNSPLFATHWACIVSGRPIWL